MMNAIEFLRKNEAKGATDFLEQAKLLRSNWPWMEYSYAIAIKAASKMKRIGLTQQQLASKLGCTQQHISNLLRGKVNMTLETISKLESALDLDLIRSNLLNFDQSPVYPSGNVRTVSYLNDNNGEKVEETTKDKVDGWRK